MDNQQFQQNFQQFENISEDIDKQILALKMKESKVDIAWRIFEGSNEKMPERGFLSDGIELFYRIIKKFNGIETQIKDINNKIYNTFCIKTPTKNFYFFFLGEKYRVYNVLDAIDNLNFIFPDSSKEHVIFLPTYSFPNQSILRHNKDNSIDDYKKSKTLKQKGRVIFSKIGSELSKVKDTYKKDGLLSATSMLIEKGGRVASDIGKSCIMQHSFLIYAKYSHMSNKPNIIHYDSMKIENKIHFDTMPAQLKKLLKEQKIQKEKGTRPQIPFNYSCVFYTYQKIYEIINNSFYYDIDDRLIRFLNNKNINIENLLEEIIQMLHKQLTLQSQSQSQSQSSKHSQTRSSKQSQTRSSKQLQTRSSKQLQTKSSKQLQTRSSKQIQTGSSKQIQTGSSKQIQTGSSKQIQTRSSKQIQMSEECKLRYLLHNYRLSDIKLSEEYINSELFVNKSFLLDSFSKKTKKNDEILCVIVVFCYLKLKYYLCFNNIRKYNKKDDLLFLIESGFILRSSKVISKLNEIEIKEIIINEEKKNLRRQLNAIDNDIKIKIDLISNFITNVYINILCSNNIKRVKKIINKIVDANEGKTWNEIFYLVNK